MTKQARMRADAIDEAGFEVFCLIAGKLSEKNQDNEAQSRFARAIAAAAIDAYEKMMPKPKPIANLMDASFHSYDVNSARVRLFAKDRVFDISLPQPSEAG
jgi:hypothetical protein